MKYNEQYELYKKLLWLSKRGTNTQKDLAGLVRESIKDIPLWDGTITLIGPFLLGGGGFVPWVDLSIIGKHGEFLKDHINPPKDIKDHLLCPIKIHYHYVEEDNLFAQAQWARDYLAEHVLSHVELAQVLGRVAKGHDIGKAFANIVNTQTIPHLQLMVDKQLL